MKMCRSAHRGAAVAGTLAAMQEPEEMSPAWRLQMAIEREHVVAAIAMCQERWQEFGEVIAEASDAEDARRGLVTAFALDEVQATAVLDMQFRRISGLDRRRITDELTQLRSEVARMREQIAADPEGGRRRPQQRPATEQGDGWWGYEARG